MVRTIDPIMEQAILKLRMMSNYGQLRYLADIREAQLHDEASYLSEARAEGIAEGVVKGRAEGIAEGVAKGRAEGIAEGRADLLSALREMGIDEDILKKAAEKTN